MEEEVVRDFHSNRGGGFRGNRFGGNRRGDRTGDRPMYKAVCTNCGNDCEVPFRPTGDKPVLCRDCFAQQRDSEPRGSFERRERPRQDSKPSQNNSADFEALNKKLDTILDVVLNMKKELKQNSNRTITAADLIGSEEE